MTIDVDALVAEEGAACDARFEAGQPDLVAALRRDGVGVYGIAGMSDHSIVSASLRSTAALRARSPAILDRLDAMRKRES